MFKFLAVLCCLFLFQQSIDALSRQKDEKPENLKFQKGCYVAALKKVLCYGTQESDPNKCLNYACSEPIDSEYAEYYEIQDCPTYIDCTTIEGDKSAPYPGCCPKPGDDCTRAVA